MSAGPVSFTRAAMWRGARDGLPMVVGTLPFGLVCGITAHGAGLSLAEAGLMSAFCYAGSAQLVALGGWAWPAPVLAASLAAFAVNLRLALMGPVLSPILDRLRGVRLWGTLFFMADQNWALAVRDMNAGGRDAAYLLGTGVSMWAVWVTTTLLGHAAGGILQPPPGHPVFFAALAVFVAVLVTTWRGARDLLPWGVAALVSVVVARVAPGGAWYIVAGALAGSLVGALRERPQP